MSRREISVTATLSFIATILAQFAASCCVEHEVSHGLNFWVRFVASVLGAMVSREADLFDLGSFTFEVLGDVVDLVVLLLGLVGFEIGKVDQFAELVCGHKLLRFLDLSLHHCLVIEVEVDVRFSFPRCCFRSDRCLLQGI